MAPHARYMLVIDSYDRNVIHGKTQNNQYASLFICYSNWEKMEVSPLGGEGLLTSFFLHRTLDNCFDLPTGNVFLVLFIIIFII